MNKSIKIVLNKCLNRDIREVKKIIKDMSYLSCKAANKGISMWKDYAISIIEKKNEDKNFDQSEYEKNTYGKTYRNVVEKHMKDIMNICNTSNVSTMHQQLVQNDWKRLKKDVINYRANLPTYKLDTPVYIKNNNYVLRNYNGYYVDIGLYSKEGLQSIGEKAGYKIEFKIDKLDNNKKSVLNKIISGEYKQGSSQLSISKKGKIEFIISFSFEPQLKELDVNRLLGIDLGIVNVAAMSIWDNNTKDWDYFSWKNNVISGKELIAFRQKEYNKRRELSIANKCPGKGKTGHGYKTRMKSINRVRNKISNFSNTYNHKVSRYIVDFAIKNNCGVIQMEDLSKATADVHKKFLKEWSYYDLQQKIKDKSDEIGIKVIFIDPMYTSKRCSNCGCIHEDNRNCKENQGKFECVICNHRENADVNASKNISIPNVDIIIKETEVVKCS